MTFEALTSACYAIVDEIEKVTGHSAILGDCRGQITALREKKNSRGLTLFLKELLQWTNTLPTPVRDAVTKQLSARGLGNLQDIDPQRVKRVLKRGAISTASEYRAVQEYIDQPRGDDDFSRESLDRLAAMLVEFGVRKKEKKR